MRLEAEGLLLFQYVTARLPDICRRVTIVDVGLLATGAPSRRSKAQPNRGISGLRPRPCWRSEIWPAFLFPIKIKEGDSNLLSHFYYFVVTERGVRKVIYAAKIIGISSLKRTLLRFPSTPRST
jgi:hypothetical protein